MKVCINCKLNKELSEFYKTSKKRKNTIRSICKTCFLLKYPHKTTEKTKLNWQKYKKTEKGIVTGLLNSAKDRAKRKNLPFELDKEWLIEKLRKDTCELTNIKFDFTISKEHRANPFSPSIDKIDPPKGYTKQNSRLICFCVNMARSDWGDEVLFKMAKELINNQKI